MPKIAIIQSGGGAKGAYGLGVMRALMTGASPATGFRPVEPEVYTGTSVGAYNSAILASQPGARPLDTLDYLEQIWRQYIANQPGGCGNGVFRLRGLPVQELEPSCFLRPVSNMVNLAADSVYLMNQAVIRAVRFATSDLPLPGRLLETPDISAFFDPQPLRNLIWSTIDMEGLRRSPRELAVATSNWENGLTRLFWKDEIVAHREYDAILASTAIPGIFPPVEIHGVYHVDGGVTMNTPLKPAIRAGADVLHVIYLDPVDARAPAPRYTSTFEDLARIYAILNAAQIRNDIEVAESVNRGLAILRRMSQNSGDTGDMLRDLHAAERILARLEYEPRRSVTIHRYIPGKNLASGYDLLYFDLDQINALIDQGYQDTVHHDCGAAECVVPEEDRAHRAEPRDRRRDGRERIGIR